MGAWLPGQWRCLQQDGARVHWSKGPSDSLDCLRQNGFCKDDGSMARIGLDIAMLKDAVPGCRRLIEGARAAAGA